MNPLVELHAYGQSFWYDNMRRKFLHDGTIQTLIDDDGLRGITSNPSIFEKAIGDSDDYDDQMRDLIAAGADTNAVYEALAIRDIQIACDMFADLYARSGRSDGFVSLEVSPYLAHDTEGTVAEARRLYAMVDRPNVMIKVPATPAGIPAIERLIGDGINVNITLMFNMAHYEAVANAYINGLHRRLAAGGDLSQVASVASFFISRVDSKIDAQLAQLDDPAAEALLGQVAIANAKVVYQRFRQIFYGPAFDALRAARAGNQRVLWASTSTKNPAYSATMYVDRLIGPETVNTMPPETIDAFRASGTLAATLEADVDQAQAVLDDLAALGISVDQATEALQADGVAKFAQSFDGLMKTLDQKIARLK